MKKMLASCLLSLAALSTAAAAEGRTLIAHFSWSGRTEAMATTIAQALDADLYRIESEEPYPVTNYMLWGNQARDERDADARPAIRGPLPDMSQYDRLFIGYPIWWHTAPMVIGTFLESVDTGGLEIHPFSQSDSMDRSQFASSLDFIRRVAPDADVQDGLFARPNNRRAIQDYLQSL